MELLVQGLMVKYLQWRSLLMVWWQKICNEAPWLQADGKISAMADFIPRLMAQYLQSQTLNLKSWHNFENTTSPTLNPTSNLHPSTNSGKKRNQFPQKLMTLLHKEPFRQRPKCALNKRKRSRASDSIYYELWFKNYTTHTQISNQPPPTYFLYGLESELIKLLLSFYTNWAYRKDKGIYAPWNLDELAY